MRKLFLSVGCALILLATATVSDAAIFVKMTDGTVAGTVDGLVDPTPGIPTDLWVKGGLRFAKPSVALSGTTDVTDTLTLLSCTTRPCRIYFPGGEPVVTGATPPAGALFRLEDVSSTSLARVEKF